MQKPRAPTPKAPTSASVRLGGKEMASAVQVRVDMFTFWNLFTSVYIYFSGFTLPWHFKNKIKNWIWLSPIFPFKFPSLRMTPVEATYIQLPLLSGSGSSFVYNNWSIVGLYTRNSDLKSILLILLFFVELRLRARPGIASGMSLRSPIMLIVSAGLGCLALF